MQTEPVTTHPYPKHSAGRLMTAAVPVVTTTATVAAAKQILLKNAATYETINYIYLVDAALKLVGVVSLKELFSAPETALVQTLSPAHVVTAHAYTDQERVVLFALKHSLKAVPVVGKAGEFLGVVPSDTILSVLHAESIEDVLKLAGARTSDDPVRDFERTSVVSHYTKRAPWLAFGLLGGMVAAGVVSFFEASLAEQLVLVAFIPAVVYMADAVGSQTQMIFVRSLALDHSFSMRRYLWRELRINALLAVTLGFLMYGATFFWLGSGVVSIILGLSIAVTIVVSMLVAIGLPWLLQRSGQDPAIASGPPATVTRDIMSLVIYFVIAGLFIS